MYLDRIVETKHQEVAKLRETFRISDAEQRIADLPPTRGFERALSASRKRSMGLIAEVKKASPSKGLIRPDFDPVMIARSYEAADADCLSVLTDQTYFQGSGQYLQDIRKAVQLPLLRKDFIIDEAQIYEARLLGADAILLIASILDKQRIAEFIAIASAIGLDCLIEVHDGKELESVLELEHAALIGINNRNLRTFETSLETTAELAARVPKGVTLISESGIASPADISYLHYVGAHGVLVGEHFMRQDDVFRAVNDLMGPMTVAADLD
ncbi:indole-3-glycerol phosphate synthase TrpC [Paenibacillus sp. JCM 10914]|uniref:indole-3-glycerol phosphate synthase TrpC n=1 Tax=Paenibacillus sp. JCM 10914 TaxID=1236974 RepID=UPI0003CCA0DE|nr:indole-3-glycerol phosphate synthase TrpC [Paenibacillus sp. JCM 10914]GAE04677.1 indole-3-glycerol phosphate synthase [Paenibacillus sp. JCM 10914]